MKRTLLDSAAKTVVVATAAKLGSACPLAVAPVTAIDVLVTEASAPAAVLEGLRAAGVELIGRRRVITGWRQRRKRRRPDASSIAAFRKDGDRPVAPPIRRAAPRLEVD